MKNVSRLVDVSPVSISKLSNRSCNELIKTHNLHHSWLSTNLKDKRDMLIKVRDEKVGFVEQVRKHVNFPDGGYVGRAVDEGRKEGLISRMKRKRGGVVEEEGGEDKRKRNFLKRLVEASVHITPSGSGVFIGMEGGGAMFLTCAHCLEGDCDCVDGDDDNDDDFNPPPLLGRVVDVVTSTGLTFSGRCVAVDVEKDVALLRYDGEGWEDVEGATVEAPVVGGDVVCVGNPYDWDLEGEKGAKPRKNGFMPFHASYGTIEERGAKVEGCGGMIHGCWTYWGHSGSPIVKWGEWERLTCVGIHNSWNDETGDRHGVDGEVVSKFLKEKGGAATEKEVIDLT